MILEVEEKHPVEWLKGYRAGVIALQAELREQVEALPYGCDPNHDSVHRDQVLALLDGGR